MSNARTRKERNHSPVPALIMAVAVFMSLLSLAARAATVSGFSVLVSRLQVSLPADHEIKFVTPSGVDSSTDTITLTFQSDYDLSAIEADDIDIAVDVSPSTSSCDGAFSDKSATNTPAAGVWGAAVSGQVLTLTPPTDAVLGEIPAGDCVRIRIGTNATFEAGDGDQIINPSTAVAHTVVLGGGFGDTGTAYTFNVDSDQVTVTATVAGGGGGGGGPTCPPTCPAPTIFGVNAQNVTETEADILWNTDISATSFVDYGTTIAYGSTASTGGTTFNHSVHLSGLTPGTLYHYRVRSTGSGPESMSGDFTFTTLDATAPALSNIDAVDITGTSARIVWDTNEDADSKVDYGTAPGPPYPSTQSSATLTNSHSLTLVGLTPNTLYRYRVTSEDASNNAATSVEFTFMTLDTAAPIISGINVDLITQSSARVNWTTDELANSTVRYGLTDAYGSVVQEAASVANHQIALSGLAANTLYHFSVSSHDASRNGATSTDQTFTTLADTTPPANVTGFTVTPSNQQNSLAWTNPVDADFAGVRIKRSTTGYPATPTSGTTVYESNGTSVIDVGLTNGTLYYYTAFAFDSSGNFASGAIDDGMPFDTVPPGPVSNLVVTAGDAQNALSWTNPSDPDFSNVIVRRATTGFPPTPSSGTGIYNGSGTSYLDTGLTNGTTYYYSVFARDTSGNHSGAAQASGTPAATPPPAPVCGDNVCQVPEDSNSCPADCPAGPPPAPVCGDAVCEAPEDNASCPADCPVGPPPPAGPVCGDAICEAPEDNASCPADCPAPSVEPPVVPPPQSEEESIDANAIRYYALSRRLELHRDASGFFRILANRSLSIVIATDAPPRTVRSMTLNFGEGSFLFSRAQDGGDWSVDVSVPGTAGIVSGTIIIAYEDDTNDVVPFEVRVESAGSVYARKDGRDVPVAGAVVTLYRRINPWIVWDASAYLQNNPVTTGADGSFAFMAPQGEYYISVSADGYRTSDSAPFNLTTEVVNPRLELLAVPPTLTEVIVPGAPVVENIGNVARALGAQGAYVTRVFQNEIVEDPRVKTAATSYVVPAAAAITTAVVATAVQATSIISYFFFLLTQPILLLGRRKRKEFGTVFNSLTKLPVDLAIIRLFRSNGKIVRTSATDKLGRYAFLVDPGEYRIEVSKQGYTFPSQYLKDKKEDGQYLDLYHGETIRAGEQGAVITANVPMDPLDIVKSTKRLYWEEVARKAQTALALSGVILTIVAALLYRLTYLWILAAVQILLYLLFRRLARPKRPKNWGIIYDETTKKPIPFAVARIIETQYNKVLESRVTDARGRYNFLVGNNKYVVTVEKPGYEPRKTDEIDLTGKTSGEGVIDMDIPLKEKRPE